MFDINTYKLDLPTIFVPVYTGYSVFPCPIPGVSFRAGAVPRRGTRRLPVLLVRARDWCRPHIDAPCPSRLLWRTKKNHRIGANNGSATFPPWGILHNNSRLLLFRGDWIGVYCRRSGIGMLLAKLQVHMSTS